MSYIKEHCKLFVQVTKRTLDGMFGLEDLIHGALSEHEEFVTSKDFYVAVLFTGTIQGEYILAMDERTATAILGIADEKISDTELEEMRCEFSEPFFETLNTVVGETIQELGKTYKRLTFSSPRIHFGSSSYPSIPTAKGIIHSDYGEIECHFYLNHMKLDLSTSYRKTLENYLKARSLATVTKQTIEHIISNLSGAIFTIDKNLNLQQEHYDGVNQLFDFEASYDSQNFMTILYDLTKDTQLVKGFISWVKFVFSSSDLDWQKDCLPICNCNQIVTRGARMIKFSWIPLYDSSHKLEKILAIAEEVTNSGRDESEIKAKDLEEVLDS